jgi:hypothetical protein
MHSAQAEPERNAPAVFIGVHCQYFCIQVLNPAGINDSNLLFSVKVVAGAALHRDL